MSRFFARWRLQGSGQAQWRSCGWLTRNIAFVKAHPAEIKAFADSAK